MKKSLLLATAALMVSGVPALAQDDAKEPAAIPPAAAQPEPAEEAKKDTPKKENKAPNFQRAHSLMDQADADGDGIVTKDEFLKNSEKFFAVLDTNSDGKVTKEEVETKRAEFRKKMRDFRDKRKAEKAAQEKAVDAVNAPEAVKSESITQEAPADAPVSTPEATPAPVTPAPAPAPAPEVEPAPAPSEVPAAH